MSQRSARPSISLLCFYFDTWPMTQQKTPRIFHYTPKNGYNFLKKRIDCLFLTNHEPHFFCNLIRTSYGYENIKFVYNPLNIGEGRKKTGYYLPIK